MSRFSLRRVASKLQSDPQSARSDAELLEQFATIRDEAAFAELVTRHGGLVRGAARRCLGDHHAAEARALRI